MIELRRHFHRHPELSYEEVATARVIMEELDRLGIPYEYGGKGGGVVGRLTGQADGPVIALRAEMDALPCTERTGLPYASSNPGRMHACGHDAHMAMVLGAAALLREAPPPGTVLFVFQPAEEKGNGATVMVESGLLQGIEAIFAAHVTHHYPVGEIMVSEGTITSHSDPFTIRVRGKGGHGARPHEAVDAVVITSLLVMAIQTLVSREINPVHPSVVTIGSIRAGSAANVIAEHALLEGVIRTTRSDARQHLMDGLHRMANAFGDVHGAAIAVEFGDGSPPVVNTARETTIARHAARQVVGDRRIVEQEYPSMGAEDFSLYLDKTPGCYVRLGARHPDDDYVPLHSPLFTVDEDALGIGTAYFERLAHEAIRLYAKTGEREDLAEHAST